MDEVLHVIFKDGYVIEKGLKNGKPHMIIRRNDESNN